MKVNNKDLYGGSEFAINRRIRAFVSQIRDKDELKAHKKEAIITAVELRYPDDTLMSIIESKTDSEIQKCLTSARMKEERTYA